MKIKKNEILEIVKFLTPFVKKPIESVIVKFFLNTGSTLLIGAFTTPLWHSIAVELIDEYFDTRISETASVITWWLIATVILCWGLAFGFYWFAIHKQNEPKNKKISIYQHSIENIIDKNPVNKDENFYEIDLRSDLKDQSIYGIKKAIDMQFEKMMAVQDTIKREKHKSVYYYGLASIPFTMLLGYNISDKYNIIFNEWNSTNKEWIRLPEGNNYPEIVISSKNKICKNNDIGELILRVNFTTRIEDEHISNISLDTLNIIDFGVASPERGVIKCQSQLIKYQDEFRNLLDRINDNYPNVSKWHVFMSAQPSIVFTLGTKFSERMDAEVIIYEYARRSKLRYPWGLKLTKDNKNLEDMIVESVEGELHVQHE